MAIAGVLDKTVFGYLVRENADIGNLDYSGDFSVELAVAVDHYQFEGDYAELMRHGEQASTFGATSGWSIGFGSYGYSSQDEKSTILAVVNDGTNRAQATTQVLRGSHAIVLTWEAASSTLTLYVDGVQVDTQSVPGLTLGAVMPGDMCIGGNNKVHARYASQFGLYPCPNFRMWIARIYQSVLTQTDIDDLWERVNTEHNAELPAGFSATPVGQWIFGSEVGDVNGNPGTGWAEDVSGTNHLQIVEAHTGGKNTNIFVSSGTIRGTSPTDGKTGVGGNVLLEADGVIGTEYPMMYQWEVATNGSFSNSILSDWRGVPWWRVQLDPATLYYWRVRCRDASGTPVTSGWSSTMTFTTRAGKEHFVRPLNQSTNYGKQDGTTYDDAWNGLRWNGGQKETQTELTITQWMGGADFRQVAPGDVVWMNDDHGLTQLADWPGSNFPKEEMLRVRGTAANPVQLRYDNGTNPGRSYKFFKWMGNPQWQAEGGGVFSSAHYPTLGFKALGVGVAEPDIDVTDWMSDTLLYEDAGQTLAQPGWYINASRLYVRLSDDSDPGVRLWFLITGNSTYRANPLSCQYVDIHGGSHLGTWMKCHEPFSECANIRMYDVICKYNIHDTFVRLGELSDDWLIERCEFSYGYNGVYAYNTGRAGDGSDLSADRCTLRNSHIHHIGVLPGRWENDDAHGCGAQASSGWLVEFNLIELCSTTIEFWSETKDSKDNIIRNNVSMDTSDAAITYGAGVALTGGAPAGTRTGFEVLDNVMINTVGSGVQNAVDDNTLIRGNLCLNTGTGTRTFTQFGIGLSSNAAAQACRVLDNVTKNSNVHEVQISAANRTNITFDGNVYFTDGGDTDRFRSIVDNFTGTFAGWQFLGLDPNGQFADPAVVDTQLPATFESFKRDMFLGPLMGDVDRDGVVTQNDLDIALAQPVPNSAYIRIIQRMMGQTGQTIDGTVLDGNNTTNSFFQKLMGTNIDVQIANVTQNNASPSIRNQWKALVVKRDVGNNVEVRLDNQVIGTGTLTGAVNVVGLAKDVVQDGSLLNALLGDVVVADAVLTDEELAGLLTWGKQQGWR